MALEITASIRRTNMFKTVRMRDIKRGDIFINSRHDPAAIVDGTYTQNYAVYMALGDYDERNKHCKQDGSLTRQVLPVVNLKKAGQYDYGRNTVADTVYILDATLAIEFIRA